MSTKVEFAWMWDCDKQGCDPKHEEDGTIAHEADPEKGFDTLIINNHATTLVERTVTYTPWKPVEA